MGGLAIDLVLKNPRLLERLRRKTLNYQGWQVLIPVTKVVDGIPREIGEERIFQIKVDFDRLRSMLKGRPFLSDPRFPEKEALFGLAAAYRRADVTLDRVEGFTEQEEPLAGRGKPETLPSKTQTTIGWLPRHPEHAVGTDAPEERSDLTDNQDVWSLPHVISLPDFNAKPLNGEDLTGIKVKYEVQVEVGVWDPELKAYPVVIGGTTAAVKAYVRHLRSTWPVRA
jgi:hypothetical protein